MHKVPESTKYGMHLFSNPLGTMQSILGMPRYSDHDCDDISQYYVENMSIVYRLLLMITLLDLYYNFTEKPVGHGGKRDSLFGSQKRQFLGHI